MVIFLLFEKKPPLYRLKPTFAWRITSSTSSGGQSFKMIFSGVTILQGGGSNFPFSYWFLSFMHGPYNSAALLRYLWCFVSWAAAPCAWTLRAPTRKLLTYLLLMLMLIVLLSFSWHSEEWELKPLQFLLWRAVQYAVATVKNCSKWTLALIVVIW